MNENYESIWGEVTENLSVILDKEAITMVKSLKIDVKDDVWTLYAINKFARDAIERDYFQTIKNALKKKGVQKIKLSIAEQPNLFDHSDQRKTKAKEHSDNLNKDYQFSNFVAGPSNDQAFAAAQRVAEGYLDFNPLLIYGGTGLGKSHLMHATGNALKMSGKKRVLYITAEQYVNDLVDALNPNVKTKNIRDFNARYREVDVLLIDDVQFIAEKNKSQEEFFNTFNSLFDNKKQIILTCDRYPKEIEGLEDRLKSRFGSGLSVSVVPPELETRAAILLSKASKLDFHLPSEVALFIAQRVVSNVRELEGALRSLYAYCDFKGKHVATIEYTKAALKDLFTAQNKQITLPNIQKVIAHYYGLNIEDLQGKSRKANIARARQVAMMLSKDLTTHSLSEIGKSFGGRDHSTVLHACRKIEDLIQQDHEFDEEYKRIKLSLTG